MLTLSALGYIAFYTCITPVLPHACFALYLHCLMPVFPFALHSHVVLYACIVPFACLVLSLHCLTPIVPFAFHSHVVLDACSTFRLSGLMPVVP